jgi:hypothetical protein
MTEGQEHEWHIELDYMRAQLHFVLVNLNDKNKYNDVKGKIVSVYETLGELCELTKGESNETE